MFELMYEAQGVGLAANQVDLPLRLFVVNTTGDPDEGIEQVFINPVMSRPKGLEEAEEGCLSIPDVRGPVTRPKRVRVQAFGLDGKVIETELEGLTARIVQHEIDHLDGVLFTDRLSTTSRLAVAEALDEFKREFASRRQLGEILSDAEITQRLSDLERRYC
jgi:peptide deformylase